MDCTILAWKALALFLLGFIIGQLTTLWLAKK